MRELTKSSISAGLAMSLLSVQMMMNAFRRPRRDGPSSTVETLDSVTQAMVDRTGNTLRETFQASDKIQRELVNLTFRFFGMGSMRPSGGMSTMSDATRMTTEGLRRWMDNTGSARGPCGCRGSEPWRPGMGAAQPEWQGPMADRPWTDGPRAGVGDPQSRTSDTETRGVQR